ncbi:DUF4395 domain-containing protein [Candidatus Parcubacteria bacterium]|nr:DUF4395 domain-containing protein [Candidatus Parcubacteria bacterium]
MLNFIDKIGTKNFGEAVKGYNIRVFNEREVRASAGILFFFVTIAFFNALLISNFIYLRVFVIVFFVDFFIRIFINPRYSPMMILGRIFVQNQKPEYTGAPQKKFAWILGLLLATTMMILIFVLNVTGIINLSICILCLAFLFFESVFGICFGCIAYSKLSSKKPQLCPGNVCEISFKEDVQIIKKEQMIVLSIFLLFISIVVYRLLI